MSWHPDDRRRLLRKLVIAFAVGLIVAGGLVIVFAVGLVRSEPKLGSGVMHAGGHAEAAAR